MTRTDIHSPTNLVTEDYVYEFAAYHGPGGLVGIMSSPEGRAFWHELVSSLDPATAERGTNQCHHCGAHLVYFAILRHTPTGHTIVVGETCLDNRFERATADFHRMRKQAELDRKKQRIKQGVEQFATDNPDLAWMADPEGVIPEHSRKNDFIADVARKLRQYGSLSDRQIEAVRKSVIRDAEFAAKKAADKARPKVDVPQGRFVLTGKVISRKVRDTEFGPVWKITIENSAGWRVWVSEPSSITTEVGDQVKLTATVTASNDDPSFGFGKRPAKAEVLK